MKPLVIDLALAAAMALLPRSFGGGVEGGRLLILGTLYAAVSVMAHFGVILQNASRAATAAFGVTLLILGWLQSFPAGDHRADIGLYILFGALMLTRERHAVRSIMAA